MTKERNEIRMRVCGQGRRKREIERARVQPFLESVKTSRVKGKTIQTEIPTVRQEEHLSLARSQPNTTLLGDFSSANSHPKRSHK